MKILLFFALLIPRAFALNQTFLQMPADREYMGFILGKYLSWHQKNFSFPVEDPFQKKLLGRIDHWLVPESPLRQITVTHGGDLLSLRLYIAPDLRKEVRVPGAPATLPPPWFAEWFSDGTRCFVFRESASSFDVWCRKKSDKDFRPAWKETLTNELPQNWKVALPYVGSQFLTKSENGTITEVSFFNVIPHPSRIPRYLYRALYLHTKEVQFPVDRASTTRDGRMKLHYP